MLLVWLVSQRPGDKRGVLRLCQPWNFIPSWLRAPSPTAISPWHSQVLTGHSQFRKGPLETPPLRVRPAPAPLWVLFTLLAIPSATLLWASTTRPPELIIAQWASRPGGGCMVTSCGCSTHSPLPLTPLPPLHFSQFPTWDLDSAAAFTQSSVLHTNSSSPVHTHHTQLHTTQKPHVVSMSTHPRA